MNYTEYVKSSLELHLFFARIMKEHSFFLETAFMERDKELKRIANSFQHTFADILDEVIDLADGNINEDVIKSQEFVTDKTLEVEELTSELTGIEIDSGLTMKEININFGTLNINEDLVNKVCEINKRTLPVINSLVQFKSDLLNKVLSGKLYTANYPALIMHIMREAKMYYNLLSKIENKEIMTVNYIYEQEMFWNNIMREHAEFIRGLLDPSEKKLIYTANSYVIAYENIIKNYSVNYSSLTRESLKETIEFKKFKEAGNEGVLKGTIKSVIVPLLVDHVLREANHFIRILNTYKQN